MIFLLDTNVISELRKRKPHGALMHWFASYPQSAFALPSIALFEIQAGAEKTRMQDPLKVQEIERWLEILTAQTVLDLDTISAREAARLFHRKSRAVLEDAMIAAIASTNGLTVATRNVRDFTPFNVPLVNPFDPA